MQPVYDLIRPYWPTLVAVLLGFVIFPLATAALNWLLWWDTPAAWEAFALAHPSRALWIRRLRAVSPHLRKLVVLSRDAAAARTSLPARGIVDALSPRVEVLAAKAGAVAVSDTRGGFDPAARQTIAPDVVAVAQRITRESERGYATVRALAAVVVVLAVGAPMGALIAGCPRLPPVSGCQPEAQTCIADSPHVCSASQRWHRAGDISCSAVGGQCLVAGGRAYCAPLADGGVR
jgi:hypothetical protein